MKKPTGKDFDEFLKLLLNESDEENEVRQEVGTISKERIAEIVQIDYEHEDLQEEITRKMDDYSKQLKREYASKIFELENRKHEFWENVYKDIGSNGRGNHQLDRKTGVISKEVTGIQ